MTFSDKKAKLLAQGISRNDTVTDLAFRKCKLRVNHMQSLCEAIGVNESVEYIRFEHCNLL